MKKSSVVIVEMGLRDGLQNEKTVLDADTRVEFAKRLIDAGTKRVEIGSFVSPTWVPQMAGTADVLAKTFALQKVGKLSKKAELSVLVPNERGLQDAIQSGVKEVAIFAACSESFSKKNINCSIEESFQRFAPVMALAKKHKIKVRGYLSTCFGCPFEGKVSEAKVVKLAQRMHKLGVYELSIGDTIGVADVGQVRSLFKKLKKVVPAKKLAGHFHDTRGQALANILAAYDLGITVFDTSLGGLGGCPYAPGATGNVATEDVVYMLHGMGVKTGLNLDKLLEINPWIAEKIQHPLPSKVGKVGRLKPLGKV
ncbi:hydroxymethylglutaryl-CoA lyase [Bdellovibrio svalbardensis]|uniref:Hydroxymethylglutaryl-CoA lyase n=1 Tax=Bdellovibrio svalbardensis TaxID=2972972 RepID=A0ABT6DH93_9BACT|nr:hydroxymethylglutaryl-CoA lyase [Bdellovibrio svalbardensis]MDG0815221.1 hydroxymethylglutaryl-CoA lyase [Bdellovibrio svalbardensis]